MSVANGELANQTTFNDAFVSREVDTNTVGKLDLQNTDVASGADVINAQREINSLDSYTGRSSGSVYNALPSWANSQVGTGTDTLFDRTDALTERFDDSTGHRHTGVDGHGPKIDAGDLTGLTSGAIAFGGASGEIAEDPTQFFWDAANNWLGIGTNAPVVGIDLATDLAVRDHNDATAGNIDALATVSFGSIRLTGAVTALRGITDGEDGKIVFVINATGGDFDILNQDSNPTAADRIITGTGADVTMKNGSVFQFKYDATTARWRVSGGAGSSITTPISVADGGTGSTTLTANNVILGNGTSAVQFVAPSTSGNVLTSNGTTWQSTAPAFTAPTIQAFSSGSGNYSSPAGVKWIKVTVIGAGGGGGGVDGSGGAGGGGGGGGTAIWFAPSGFVAATNYAYSIGSGGAGGANTGANGSAGGDTTFTIGATTVTGGGGGGGGWSNAGTAAGGFGGTSSNGSINQTGGGGMMAYGTSLIAGNGGNSSLGGGGHSGFGASTNGGANGGGGAGASNTGAQAGGDGANGILIIEEYYQ